MTGIEALKPLLTALVLPPVPWLLMILVGARWRLRRPGTGRALIGLGVALIWLSACQATGGWLQQRLDLLPPAITASDIAELKATDDGRAAIVVLGGGLVRDPAQPGPPELHRSSLERLQHGLRLARDTGLPLAFSGGLGWAQQASGGPSEAETARRVAAQDFGQPIRWVEGASRDTRENARLTWALLAPLGIRQVVVVTHAWHMPRALREFRRSAPADARVIGAPVRLMVEDDPVLRWLPTSEGFEMVRTALREWLGQQVARITAAPALAAARTNP